LLNYFLIIFYILTIFGIAVIYKKFRPNNKELLRKIIHIGIGPLVIIAKYLGISQFFAGYFTFLISLLIVTNYIYKLFPIIEDVERKSYGTFFYCISLLFLIILFWDKDPYSLMAGFLIMTFGDGLAGLIGKNFTSKDWRILNQKKSLLGTTTMFISSLIVLISVGLFGNFSINGIFIFIALLATILEQISFYGIDNFTVPIITSIFFNISVTKL
tara:strand:+ start:292 stop:936 length:645 start_codon:yes stop_codon:yes gene_type:complete